MNNLALDRALKAALDELDNEPADALVTFAAKFVVSLAELVPEVSLDDVLEQVEKRARYLAARAKPGGG